MTEQTGLPEQQEIDSLEETLLQVSAHKRLIVSPSGSLLVVYSRRDLVRMHKAKSRAILKADKPAKDAQGT